MSLKSPEPLSDLLPYPPRIGWSQRCYDNCLTVFVVGELDLAVAAELRARLAEVVRTARTRTIVLELSGVRFIDAHCAGLIVGAHIAAGRQGRQLRVASLRPQPSRLFGLLGLEGLLAHAVGSGPIGSADE